MYVCVYIHLLIVKYQTFLTFSSKMWKRGRDEKLMRKFKKQTKKQKSPVLLLDTARSMVLCESVLGLLLQGNM